MERPEAEGRTSYVKRTRGARQKLFSVEATLTGRPTDVGAGSVLRTRMRVLTSTYRGLYVRKYYVPSGYDSSPRRVRTYAYSVATRASYDSLINCRTCKSCARKENLYGSACREQVNTGS